MAVMPTLRLFALPVVLLIAGGCAGAGSPSSPSQTSTITAAAATLFPTAAPTPEPTTEATPVAYYEVEKTAEGAHGGTPVIDLPASIVVDYTVNGACEFTIEVWSHVPDNAVVVAKLAISVTGTTVSGSWPIHIEAGPSYVAPGEAVGCTFHLLAHAPV